MWRSGRRFRRQELERLRRQRLVMLRNARDDPDAIAALAFARGIYGPSHRNAAALIGTADSLQAVDGGGSPRLSRGPPTDPATAP